MTKTTPAVSGELAIDGNTGQVTPAKSSEAWITNEHELRIFNATIERCARVAEQTLDSHGIASGHIAAAIRALKEKPKAPLPPPDERGTSWV